MTLLVFFFSDVSAMLEEASLEEESIFITADVDAAGLNPRVT